MALPNTNLSVAMVKAELGAATNNVGQLCIHPNINKWSKWKPVRHSSPTPIIEAQLKSTNYGIGDLRFTPEDDILAQTKTGVPTPIYVKPSGGIGSPYRLTDFAGYNRYAVTPIIFEMEAIVWNQFNSIKNGSNLSTKKLVTVEDRDYDKGSRTGYKVSITLRDGVNADIKLGDLMETINYGKSRLTLIIGKVENGKLGSSYRVYQDSVNIGTRTSINLFVDTSKLDRAEEMSFSSSDKIIVCACVMGLLGNDPYYEGISGIAGTLRLKESDITITAETKGVLYQGGIGGERPVENINVNIEWAKMRAVLFSSGSSYEMMMEAMNITMSKSANVNIIATFPSTGQSIVVGSFSGTGMMAGGNTITIPSSYISGINPRLVNFKAVKQSANDDVNIISNTITESYYA